MSKNNPHYQGWVDYFRSEKSDLHVMPNDDKHECSEKCFCGPTVSYADEVTGRKVFLHKGPEELMQ